MTEKECGLLMGLSATDVRTLMRKKPAVEKITAETFAVIAMRAGIDEAVASRLLAEVEAVSTKKTAPAAAIEAQQQPEGIDLPVCRFCPNPTWILSVLPNRETVHVMVPNHRRLALGMTLKNCVQIGPKKYQWRN